MNDATIRQAAILVGGEAQDGHVPTPLLPVGDRPFLAWLLRELCRWGVQDVVLLAGIHGETFRAALPALTATLPLPLALDICDAPPDAGTAGALLSARDKLAPRFLLLHGDCVFDTNLGRLLADAAHDGPEVAARLLLRDGATTEDAAHARVAVVSASLLGALPERGSLRYDVIPLLAERNALRVTTASGWFADIATSEGLAHARAELPVMLGRRPALLLDRDGVLNVDHGWVGTRDRFDWIPGALDALRDACDAGRHVFVVTNQSGVARGLYGEAEVRALLGWMSDVAHASGATIDDARYCPHHPQGSVPKYSRACCCRKPAPGMLRDLIARWRLDPARCLFVGDQPTDMQAAAAAGIAGRLFPGGNLRDFLAG